MSGGIDYGMGQTNVDHETGIRFGVIPVNSITQAWCDEAESDYGAPTCPRCGNEASDIDDAPEDDPEWTYEGEDHAYDGAGYACVDCKCTFWSDEAYGDEPLAWVYDSEGIQAVQGGSDYDIFVTKSPYFTRASYCSPCAPGACHLLQPDPDGQKAYCFPADWFDDEEPCPYPVYRVSDSALVYDPSKPSQPR